MSQKRTTQATATARPDIYSRIKQAFLDGGRENLTTQLQRDFYDHLLRRAAPKPDSQHISIYRPPGLENMPLAIANNPDGSRTILSAYGEIHIDQYGNERTDALNLERLREMMLEQQQNDLKIDSTVLGTVSDIIKTLPQPRLAQLKDGSLETCERLKALGLFKAADALHNKIREKTMGKKGYRLVSVDSIKRFLQRKVEIYNQARGKETAMPISDESYAKTRTVTAFTCDYYKGGEIGRFIWKETPIQDYAGIPPTHVLDALEKAKPDFDEIYVAEVVNLPDPILIGKLKDRIEGYYIPNSQWGNDVCLDDIV